MVAVFDRIRASRPFQSLMRVLQFLSSVISLGIFSSRLYKVRKLTGRANHATGAVEGILAAAVLYTLLTTLLQCLLRRRAAHKMLRWVLIMLDIAFVGAFIAVAVLTSPKGGSIKGETRRFCYTTAMRQDVANHDSKLCKLPLGTFVLAIVSTILHFITAVLHEARDKHRANKGLNNDGDYQLHGHQGTHSHDGHELATRV